MSEFKSFQRKKRKIFSYIKIKVNLTDFTTIKGGKIITILIGKNRMNKIITIICVVIILGTINDNGWVNLCEGKFIEEGELTSNQGETFRNGVLANNYSYVYVQTDSEKYIEVINCKNRGNPQRIERIYLNSNDSIWDMGVDGKTLYILADNRQDEMTFYIIDITDPTNLALTGKYNETNNQVFLRDFAVYGNYCYILTENGMKIIDIADKSNPVLVNTKSIDGLDIHESEGRLYIDCYIEEGYITTGVLRVYSLNNPEQPLLLGELGSENYERIGMVVNGKYVYSFGGSKIKVGDFTDPYHPKKTDTYNYPEAFLDFDPSGIIREVAVTGNYLIASGEALFEFNLEKPGKIKRRSKQVFGEYYCQYLGAEKDLIVSISSSYLHIFTLQAEPAESYGKIIGFSISGVIVLGVIIFTFAKKRKKGKEANYDLKENGGPDGI